jgi:ParB-like chromosome segregation protein Spo0J
MAKPIDYCNLKPHPLAKRFPPYPPEKLKELAEDIKVHGLNYPIVLFEGKILVCIVGKLS